MDLRWKLSDLATVLVLTEDEVAGFGVPKPDTDQPTAP